MTRILLPVLAVALIGGGYSLFRGGGESSGSPESGSANSIGTSKDTVEASASETRGSTAPAMTPSKPLRMRSTARSAPGQTWPITDSDSIAGAYDSEEHDSAQAAAQTELVRDTVEHLIELDGGAVQVAELDCRTHHCKLRLSSEDKKSLEKLTAALQDKRGFLGKAESLMLSRQGNDIVFYLRFSPPK